MSHGPSAPAQRHSAHAHSEPYVPVFSAGSKRKKELDDLLKRVDELNRDVRKLTGGGLRPGLTQVMNNTVRRARDDLSDLARELEDAQLAAKQTMKRTVAQVKKAVKSTRR